jgi:hypothetical protein
LTKEKVKSNFLKTDFSKWVDEDEQDGEVAPEAVSALSLALIVKMVADCTVSSFY